MIVHFDLSYEDMVKDMEGTASKQLDFAGLEWQDDVKKFYETKRTVRSEGKCDPGKTAHLQDIHEEVEEIRRATG